MNFVVESLCCTQASLFVSSEDTLLVKEQRKLLILSNLDCSEDLIIPLLSLPSFVEASDTIWISILISLLAVTMPSPQSLLPFICRLQNKLFYLWFIIKPTILQREDDSLPVHYHLFQSFPENLKVVQVNYYCDIEFPDNSYKKL